MPEEHPDPERSEWLLEPPSSGEVHVELAIGSEVELSPKARAAVERLMSHLHDDEVMGFLPPCGGLDACTSYQCSPLGKCTSLSNQPCLAHIYCKIAELF